MAVKADSSTALRNDNQKTREDGSEMRGSLHCATHDETVSSFGRDDGNFGWLGRRRRSASVKAMELLRLRLSRMRLREPSLWITFVLVGREVKQAPYDSNSLWGGTTIKVRVEAVLAECGDSSLRSE
jgi:hypothetical protein